MRKSERGGFQCSRVDRSLEVSVTRKFRTVPNWVLEKLKSKQINVLLGLFLALEHTGFDLINGQVEISIHPYC